MNDVNGFKQHLWSLFQSYSYISSGGGGADTPARRLSESGYRAIMAALASIDVLDRYFPGEDEITQREGIRRLESERFKDEVWDEMVCAAARFLDRAGSVTRNDGNDDDDDVKANGENCLLTHSYDYEVMRPSHGHRTVRWDVFVSALLLRLNGSLHFYIENDVLAQCRDALQPTPWLLPVRSTRGRSEGLKSPSQDVGDASLRGIANGRPTTAILLSPLEKLEESTLPCGDALVVSQQDPRSSLPTSHGRHSATNSRRSGGDTAAHMCGAPSIKSEPHSLEMVVSDRFGTRGGDDRQQRRVKSASSVASFSANAWSNPRGSGSESAEAAAVEVKRDATPDAVSAVRRSTGGVAMTDAVLPRSSPPPRPKQSATVPLTTASSIPSRTAAVWTGGRRRVDVDQLRQRLASCDVANMSLLDSRGWANSPSVATPLEKENCVPGTAKVGVHATDPCSEAYYARYDAEVNRRYNESRASRGWEPDATIEPSSSSSPSPKVPQQGGVQRILAPVAANLPQQMFLPPGEEVSPHSNSNVSTVAVVRHWYHDGDDNAEGRSTQGRIIAVDAVRLSQKEPICAPPLPLLLSPPPLQHQTTRLRGRPLPPQSPSRRAISRVQQGQPRHVEPVVPRTRAPPTPPGRCVVDSLAK